jgi:hypothetical protein
MMPAPGWYPVDATTQRYWDGTRWTEHVAPLAPPPSQPGLPTWAKIVLGLVAVALALPVIVVLIFAIGSVVMRS